MCVKPNSRPQKATLFHVLPWRTNQNTFKYMDGHKINGLTVPPHIAVTSSRCDLVIIDSSSSPSTVYLLELTVCFERPGNIEAANQRKYERYSSLTEDIKAPRYDCKNIPFEVGSLGLLTLENESRLSIMHKLCKPRIRFPTFWKNMTKASLLCSYVIFLSREDPWTECPLLSPVKQ